MIGKSTIESTLHTSSMVSEVMQNAIQLWSDLYTNDAPWLKEYPDYADSVRVTSLGLPAMIASEKARMATIEMKSEITAPKIDEKTGEELKNVNPQRAEYMNSQYKKLIGDIRRQLEYGIALGGLVIRPYPVKLDTTESQFSSVLYNYEMEFDCVQADGFYPLSFDATGKLLEAAFIQRKIVQNVTYSRLEYHKLEKHTVTVINKAFVAKNNSSTENELGEEIPLTQVPEWAELEPITTIQGVDRLLFAYFKMPEANTIDRKSPLGVSGYSRVINLIKDADMQYSRLLWEFEGGELAIDADRDALTSIYSPNGEEKTVMPTLQRRLFRKVDLNEENTYNVFSPALRDVSLINGLNTILTRIEDNTGLSRGTLSDIQYADARTATELKILKQRSFATNADIQRALQRALEDVVYIMDVYCTLYKIVEPGKFDISFEWDDSIIVDTEAELSQRITLIQNNIASKLETRMWYFGETEAQAKEALKKIEEERKAEMSQESKIVGVDLGVGSPNGNDMRDKNDKGGTSNPKKDEE